MKTRVLVVLMVFVVATAASAFDQKRKGFVIGLGVGVSAVSYTQELDYGSSTDTSSRENEVALRTDFKIGYGFNEHLLLYWMSKVSWFGMDNALGDHVTITAGVAGAGISYYISPEPKGLYILAGVGYSSWAAPFESDSDTWIGFGGAAGLGYEIARNWSVEIVGSWGNPKDEIVGGTATTYALAGALTINGRAY